MLYWIYIYTYTCTKTRLFLSISIHLNTKYIYITPDHHSITTFSDVCYWSIRLWTDGSYSWTNFRCMEITDTAFTHIAVCWMSSLLLILSTFFNDNGGAGSTQTILSSCDCVLLKDCWIWWLVLVTEDSVYGCSRESRQPSKLPASLSETPKWILPLSLFV